MEQNRKPRNKPMSIQSIFDKGETAHNGVKTVSSINSVGRTGLVHGENDTRPLTYTIHQNKLKINTRLKYRSLFF